MFKKQHHLLLLLVFGWLTLQSSVTHALDSKVYDMRIAAVESAQRALVDASSSGNQVDIEAALTRLQTAVNNADTTLNIHIREAKNNKDVDQVLGVDDKLMQFRVALGSLKDRLSAYGEAKTQGNSGRAMDQLRVVDALSTLMANLLRETKKLAPSPKTSNWSNSGGDVIVDPSTPADDVSSNAPVPSIISVPPPGGGGSTSVETASKSKVP